MTGFPPPHELTLHAGPMLMIDKVVEAEGNRLRAQYTVSARNALFLRGRGLPGYAVFEMMAQAVSVFDGLERRRRGEAPQIGLLLGSRDCPVSRDWLEEGECLDILAEARIDDGELRAFACEVRSASSGQISAAMINVFRPTDARAFIAGVRAGRAAP